MAGDLNGFIFKYCLSSAAATVAETGRAIKYNITLANANRSLVWPKILNPFTRPSEPDMWQRLTYIESPAAVTEIFLYSAQYTEMSLIREGVSLGKVFDLHP